MIVSPGFSPCSPLGRFLAPEAGSKGATNRSALSSVRDSAKSGCPFGDLEWVESTVKRLGLQSTVGPRGRPRVRNPTSFNDNEFRPRLLSKKNEAEGFRWPYRDMIAFSCVFRQRDHEKLLIPCPLICFAPSRSAVISLLTRQTEIILVSPEFVPFFCTRGGTAQGTRTL